LIILKHATATAYFRTAEFRREEGLFYGLDLGGTNLHVNWVGNEKHESRDVSIPPHLMSGSASISVYAQVSVTIFDLDLMIVLFTY
jgi:hypothetical protein